MLWLTAAREGLDDDHAATAAGTWTQQHAGFVDCCFGRLGFFQARRHREQLAGACDIGRAVAIGKQSVVAGGGGGGVRGKPCGRTWMRKRRMNSCVPSVMTLYRARPSAR